MGTENNNYLSRVQYLYCSFLLVLSTFVMSSSCIISGLSFASTYCCCIRVVLYRKCSLFPLLCVSLFGLYFVITYCCSFVVLYLGLLFSVLVVYFCDVFVLYMCISVFLFTLLCQVLLSNSYRSLLLSLVVLYRGDPLFPITCVLFGCII